MLGDTISITHNAVARVLSKINQDNYSTEYMLRTSTEEFRIYVRHAVETAKAGIVPFERHNIEYIHTTFPTATVALLEERVAFTIRCKRMGDPAEALKTAKALQGFLTDANLTKLIAWES